MELKRGPCKVAHHEQKEVYSCLSQHFHMDDKKEQLLFLKLECEIEKYLQLFFEAQFLHLKSYFLKLILYWLCLKLALEFQLVIFLSTFCWLPCIS